MVTAGDVVELWPVPRGATTTLIGPSAEVIGSGLTSTVEYTTGTRVKVVKLVVFERVTNVVVIWTLTTPPGREVGDAGTRVVYTGMISVVTDPSGQLVTDAGHLEIVRVEVI